MYLFQFSTCFEQPRAHHQENQLYQYNIWYITFCVGDRFVCRSERSDMYQRLCWYNCFSWWWARGCSKHVENWNKYIEKNCASSWSFTKNHNRMHGQQNIKDERILHSFYVHCDRPCSRFLHRTCHHSVCRKYLTRRGKSLSRYTD